MLESPETTSSAGQTDRQEAASTARMRLARARGKHGVMHGIDGFGGRVSKQNGAILREGSSTIHEAVVEQRAVVYGVTTG